MTVPRQIVLLGIALCVSVVIAALLFSLFIWLYFFLQTPGMAFVLYEQLHFAAIVGVFALPVALVLGMLGFFALRRLKVISWWSVCAIGTIAGGLVGNTGPTAGLPWLGCVGLGLVIATLAWVLIRRFDLPLSSDTSSATRTPYRID